MNKFPHLVCFIAFLLVLTSAGALTISGLPSEITFYQLPKEVELQVMNSTGSNQNLSVEFYGPINYEMISKPEWIPASTTEEIRMKLIPDGRLVGTVYSSTVVVGLGGDKETQSMQLTFKELAECPVEISTARVESDVNGNHKLNLKIRAENKAVEDVHVEFLGLKGIPADWSYETNDPISFVPLQGSKEMSLDMKFGSKFDGTADVTFKCGNFGERIKGVSLKHDSTTDSGITGFFVLGDLSSTEIIIDVVLVLIVAILLIAFISRVVKKFTKDELRKRGK